MVTTVFTTLLAIYELIVRIVPTEKQLTIIGNILQLLSRLSSSLDNIKKESK
jgi:hypothetical protein